MAKFCGKCGSKLDETTGLCPKCDISKFIPSLNENNPVREDHDYYTEQTTPFSVKTELHSSEPQGNWQGATDYNATFTDQTQNTPVPPQKKSHKTVWIVLIVLILLVTGVVCIGALAYFDVVEIPVISDVVDKIFEADTSESEPDGTATDAVAVMPSTTEALETTSEEATTIPLTGFTVSGVLTTEPYKLNSMQEGMAYILLLDSEIELNPYAPFDTVYGKSVKTERIEIFGEGVGLFCQKHVTIHGNLTYASENYHRETVILTDCTFEITDADAKYNREHEETTAAASSIQVTIKLDESAGADAVLNIRSGPGFEYEVVDTVVTGTTVTLLDEQNGWAYIDSGRAKGWCSITVAGFTTPGTRNRTIIPFATVSCSSDQGSGENNRKYTPDMAADGDYNTCWMAAGGEGGSGNWIQFYFDSEKTISGFEFLNGNCWDGMYNGEKVASNLYQINGRIKQFTITFSDGSK